MSAFVLISILTPIEDLLTSLLTWLHETLGLPWAWAIVALVILVRIVLVPVTVKQIHSMQNLQAHMPEMKRIQEQWKHDRQRQNEELTKFYKENRVNPAASCLPMVLQIPIFMALYFVLRDFETEIYHKFPESSLEFLGLVDITQNTKVGWGPLLIVIYALSQLTSTYFMSQTMQKSQRILMLVLPIVFIPFILNFPAGLMVYWLTTNLWTTGQGVITRTMMPRADPEALKKTSKTQPKEQEPPPPSARASRSATPTAKPKQPPPAATTTSAGPPRRVKRKRSGGGHGRR
jgi:YidC/Oxa1 family membrane protein insertase